MSLPPFVHGLHHRRQLRAGQRVRVPIQQQLEHSHEVRLAGTEAARQERGLGAVFLHRSTDQRSSFGERRQELVGDYVTGDGLRCLLGGIGELEDEIALPDLGGDGDGVAQQHRLG